MESYLSLLERVYEDGIKTENRTDTPAYTVFGESAKYDIDPGNFPIVTTRKIYWRKILDELIWFLSGSTNVNDLPERTQSWWEPWADDDGNLGPIYGKQLRNFEYPVGTGATAHTVDQIDVVTRKIKKNPQSRRKIVTTWNAGEVPKMNLPPCHGLVIQFNVQDDILNCAMYQRSCDLMVGCPNNITSYCLLTAMMAKVCDLKCGEFTHFIGNAHIYENHMKQAKKQLRREPKRKPQIKIEAHDSIDDYTSDSIELTNYKHHDAISLPVAI